MTPNLMKSRSSLSPHAPRRRASTSFRSCPSPARPHIGAKVGTPLSSIFHMCFHISPTKASLPNARGPGRRAAASPVSIAACHLTISFRFLLIALRAFFVSTSAIVSGILEIGGCSGG